MKVNVLILGGTNQIGKKLIEYFDINNTSTAVISRNKHHDTENIKYIQIDISNNLVLNKKIRCEIVICLIDSVKIYEFVKNNIITNHLIQLSSTSVYSKINSQNNFEKKYYDKLLKTDESIKKFCVENQTTYTIYRTTMIYDSKNDKNISKLQNIILKLNLMVLVEKGIGLRQPIKASDVAKIIFKNINNKKSLNDEFILVGGETLTFKSICDKIFFKNSLKPIYINIPAKFFKIIYFINLKTFKLNTLDFLLRTSVDLVFEDTNSKKKLISYNPSNFEL